MTNLKRVLHVLPGTPYGGMQRLVTQLVTEQRRRGLDARVLSLYEDPLFSQELAERKIPFTATNNTRPNLPGFWKYLVSLQEANAAIIHLHMGLLWSNGLGLLTKRKPWIGHFHSYYRPKTIKSKIFHRINYYLLDACIGVSASVSESLRPWFKKKNVNIFTVNNGIELHDEWKIRYYRRNRSINYGMATRITEDKGVWEFIQAAEAILKIQSTARFVLAGDGPLRNQIVDYVQSNKLSEQISLPGHLKDIDEFWTSLDVALFTSPCDGFGLSIIEPMSLGIPVVAYRTGFGSDELIIDEITGLRADWGDTDDFVKQCVRLSTDKALWERISNEGSKSVRENYSIKSMAEQIMEIYQEIIKFCP